MTTIIITADEIAGDGLEKNGHDRIYGTSIEKIRVRHGAIYAFAGSGAAMEPLIKWHANGADPDKLPKIHADIGWSMAVVTAGGRWFYTDKAPFPDPINCPFALGYGGGYALGAIAAGADARRAIEIAALYDTNTGGEIQVVNITEALTPKLKEAAE